VSAPLPAQDEKQADRHAPCIVSCGLRPDNDSYYTMGRRAKRRPYKTPTSRVGVGNNLRISSHRWNPVDRWIVKAV